MNKKVVVFEFIFLIIVAVLLIALLKKACEIEIHLVSAKDLQSIEVVEELETTRESVDLTPHVSDLDYTFIEKVEEKEILLEKEVEMTFYLPTGNACANCEMPTENHTVAFERSYLNCECDIYTLDGELIGHYNIDDTGYGRTEDNGKGTIQNANCVDVFFENESEGREFIAKYGNEVKIVIYEREE